MEIAVLNPEKIEFWLIVFAYELSVLTVIICRNYVRLEPLPRLTAIGLSIVAFGTIFFLIFTVSIFTLDEYTTICMGDIIDAELFGTGDLLECYTDTAQMKRDFFNGSVIMTIIIVFGNIIQAYGHSTIRR